MVGYLSCCFRFALDPQLGPLVGGSRVLEPVAQVVHLEQFARLPRGQTVELFHVHVEGEPGRVRVFGEPLMEPGQLVLRVKACSRSACCRRHDLHTLRSALYKFI